MKIRSLWYLVARQAGLGDGKAKLCERVLRALGPAVVKATKKGERVTVPGLGVFRGRQRKGREIDLPQGVHVDLPAQVVLTFRAARKVRVLRRVR